MKKSKKKNKKLRKNKKQATPSKNEKVKDIDTSGKLNSYLDLLNLTYEETVDSLKKKYGEVYDDYYREKSYSRFLNGETKTISKGKYSRAKEGLYCHHVDENKFQDISSLEAIKDSRIPYESQVKDRLVYCDLIEHAILHVQITVESHGNYGYNGFSVFIRPMIKDWMLKHRNPKPEWMKKCKERAFLNPTDSKILLQALDDYLSPFYKERLLELEKWRDEKLPERKRSLLESEHVSSDNILQYISNLSRVQLINNLNYLYYWVYFLQREDSMREEFERKKRECSRAELEEELFKLLS